MLQYYTLEQAAKLLDVNPDKAKKLLDDKKVRQYRDGRGGVRYVASAVDELARAMGRGSDPELQMRESAKAKSGNSPRPSKVVKEEDSSSGSFEFDLPLDDSAEVGIGREKLDESASASKKSPGGGPKSPRSPAPKAGSDSDVRLVTDGSDLEFQISVDSDVRMVDEAGPASSKSGSGKGKGKGKAKSPSADESDVRMVGMDLPSDSDVRVANVDESNVDLDRPPGKKHSDSDIRLEQAGGGGARGDEGSDDSLVTEEIDLDAEERKARESQGKKKKGKSRMKRADSTPALPTTSPFELSEDDLDLPKGGQKKPDSSSDFDLTPAAEDSDESIELSDSEMPALKDDSSAEEVALGDLSSSGGTGTSGINLDAPIDSGISLEGTGGSGDEMEFELSLDSGSTPKPGPKSGKSKAAKPKAPEPEDSDSEFELTLDADSSTDQPAAKPAAAASEEDSDSEFELTLDDSGGLVPLEGDKPAAAASGEESAEGDIFETDFEVPALDEESGSEAVALDEGDTDLESSDFDLALEEGDAASDEESGSQVVALEDEAEVDEAAETVQRPLKKKKKPAPAPAEEEAPVEEGDEPLEELADVDDEEAVADEEEEEAPARAARAAGVPVAAAPAQWGPLPAVVMLPCVIVMMLAGLVGYELIHSMVGYQQPGKVTGFLAESLAKSFDLERPKD